MQIYYDNIIYSLQKTGGITTYWNELIKRINEINFIKSISKKNRYKDVFVDSSEKFIFHSSYYRICKNKSAINITTVHDFTYEYYRNDLKSLVHKMQKKRAVRKSDGVICVSENTAMDLRKYYPWYKKPIKVIYHGFSDEYKLLKIERKPFFLFVGARGNYKNFELAVKIINKINGVKLVIVGGGDLSDTEIYLLNSSIPERYEKKGFVENSELSILYNQARGLLYTSDYEGFGIPALEAQSCGCPVICQRKSSLPEVVLDSAVYIPSTLEATDLNAVQLLVTNEDFFNQKQKEGYENIKRFSWDKCAKETYKFYEEIYNKK